MWLDIDGRERDGNDDSIIQPIELAASVALRPLFVGAHLVRLPPNIVAVEMHQNSKAAG